MSQLFLESEEQGVVDEPIYVGSFNNSILEVYQREFEEDEVSVCEVYLSSEGIGVLEAAKNLAAFVDSGLPENYGAAYSPDDNTVINVTVNGEQWMEVYVEGELDGAQAVVIDVDISDAELDYLQENGVLPDPDAFGDLGIEVDPEDDFWVSDK